MYLYGGCGVQRNEREKSSVVSRYCTGTLYQISYIGTTVCYDIVCVNFFADVRLAHFCRDGRALRSLVAGRHHGKGMRGLGGRQPRKVAV